MGIRLPLRLQCSQRGAGILGSHLHQLLLRAGTRNVQLYLLPAATCVEPLADDVHLLDLGGKQHLGRDIRRLVIKLLEEAGDHIGIWAFGGAFHEEVFPTDQLAAADEEHLHARLAVRAGHGDHIRVDVVAGDNFLFFDHPLDGLNLVAQCGCPLEVQRLGCLAHIGAQPGDDRFGATLQELPQIIDHLAVAGLVDGADARRSTQLDIVIQAGAFILSGDLPVAGEVGEDAAEHIQRLVHRPHAGVGAVIT